MAHKTPTDWERARRLYRLGQLTAAEIAAVVGVTPRTVYNRASREGWTRDLTEQVSHATRAALTQGADDEAAVADAAAAAAAVVQVHRSHLECARLRVFEMLGELSSVNHGPADIETALRSHLEREDIDTVVAAYSLDTRAKVAGTLATALTKLTVAERSAWNLDEQRAERPFEAMLREIISDESETDS